MCAEKELASLIPSLRAVDLNRLSKHVVIDESISFIQIMQAERQKTTDSQGSLDALVAERTDILAELNRWRASRGLEARMARSTPAKAVVVEEPAASAGDVPLGALASMDWRGSMASENRPVVLGEPENLAGPTLDDSFDLMAMPVGPVSPASLAGPTMGPLWTRPTEDFATTMDMQANCNNLLDTKQVPPAPLASPDGLMPNYMGLAAEGTGAGGAVIMVDPQTAQAGNGQAIEFAPVDSGSDSIAPLVRCTL